MGNAGPSWEWLYEFAANDKTPIQIIIHYEMGKAFFLSMIVDLAQRQQTVLRQTGENEEV